MQDVLPSTQPVNPTEAGRRVTEASPESDRLAELETICRYDRASDTASVFTCERGLAAALLRRGVTPIRENRRRGRVDSWLFEVPKSWITVRPPKRSGMTPEQKRAASERLVLHRNAHHRPGTTPESVRAKG